MPDLCTHNACVGLARTIHIYIYIYGVCTVCLAGKSYTVIYGHIRCAFTVLANPKNVSLLCKRVIAVQMCHCCTNVSLLYKRVIAVKMRHCCKNVSLLYKRVIAVQTCHCCTNVSLLQKRVIAVKTCHCCKNVSLM